jgi:hypothetical protein
MTDLININKFLNRTIGFEDVFTRFFQMEEYNSAYPFYNIKKVHDEKYRYARSFISKLSILLPLLV